MSDQRKYAPTGTGICATCGRDVGEHVDPAHKFVCSMGFDCFGCRREQSDPIHDVGRVLRCPMR